MMWVSRMPSEFENSRWMAAVTSGNASPGAVANSWSPIRATVAEVPTVGDPPFTLKYGASSERLIVKIPPNGPGRGPHVPAPLLAAGSEPTGHPSGPPAWLHDIAASRPWFSAAVENDCVFAARAVSGTRCARAKARAVWLG